MKVYIVREDTDEAGDFVKALLALRATEINVHVYLAGSEVGDWVPDMHTAIEVEDKDLP